MHNYYELMLILSAVFEIHQNWKLTFVDFNPHLSNSSELDCIRFVRNCILFLRLEFSISVFTLQSSLCQYVKDRLDVRWTMYDVRSAISSLSGE